MVRIPQEILDQLNRNQRRQQHGGVIEAALGAGLAGAGLFGTVYRAHNGWFGENASMSTVRKRLRQAADNQERAHKKVKVDGDEFAKEWTKSKARVSLPDSTSSAQAAMNGGGGDGSGNAAGLKETPVDNPYVVYRGPPDFTFASLPHRREGVVTLSDTWLSDHIYRMTSPYDVTHESSVQDLNAGTGVVNAYTESATDSTQRKARWFDYYGGMYRYYHVVSCRYRITVENLSMEPLYVHRIFCNDTIPPLGATNEDIMLWNDVESRYINPVGYAITSTGAVEAGYIQDTGGAGDIQNNENTTGQAALDTFETGNMLNHPGSSIATFTGEYRPGQFRREIRLDSEVENWTLTTTNPALPERMVIRVKPIASGINVNNTTTYGDDLKYKLTVNLDYLVEFKELQDGLKWPVQRQPITVTIAQDVSSTN